MIKILCDLVGGKLEWMFNHPDVPQDSRLINSLDQLPKCPSMTHIYDVT